MDTDAQGSPAQRADTTSQTAARWLPRLAAFETLSVVTLFANLATVHIEAVASLVGPIHGMAYLATIVCAWLTPISRRAKVLSIVPILGGYISLLVGRRDAERAETVSSTTTSTFVAAARDHERTFRFASEPDRPSQRASRTEPKEKVDVAIKVDGLYKTYGLGVQIGPLSFSVPGGSVTGLVGPNGVGKTTTIRMILGLVRPDGGRLQMLGAEGEAIKTVLPNVGALIDAPAFMPALSGRANHRLLSRLAGWNSTQVEEALSTVGLSDRADSKVREYSLGMRQRLGLAAALMGQPRLLVLDEPANALDPQGAAQLRSLLRQVADSGATVVVSSHVLSEVEQICDHLVVLAADGIAFAGSRGELHSRQKTTLLVDTEDETSRAQLLTTLVGHDLRATVRVNEPIRVTVPHADPRELMRASYEDPAAQPEPSATGNSLSRRAEIESRWAAQVNSWAVESGIIVNRLEVRHTSLEEVFFALTGDPGTSSDRLSDIASAGPRAAHRDAGQVRTATAEVIDAATTSDASGSPPEEHRASADGTPPELSATDLTSSRPNGRSGKRLGPAR